MHVRFAKPVSLAPGTEVALTASAGRSLRVRGVPDQEGSRLRLRSPTYFDGGYAQFNDGGGWVGWDQWGGHDRHDSDLQFALDVEC